MARPGNKHILLYAASEADADVLYATRFFAPDPFIFIQTAAGRRIFVMSDLEIDRADLHAQVGSLRLSVPSPISASRAPVSMIPLMAA